MSLFPTLFHVMRPTGIVPVAGEALNTRGGRRPLVASTAARCSLDGRTVQAPLLRRATR